MKEQEKSSLTFFGLEGWKGGRMERKGDKKGWRRQLLSSDSLSISYLYRNRI